MSDSSIADEYMTQSLGGQHSRLSRQGNHSTTTLTGGRSRVSTSTPTSTFDQGSQAEKISQPNQERVQETLRGSEGVCSTKGVELRKPVQEKDQHIPTLHQDHPRRDSHQPNQVSLTKRESS